MVATQSPLKNYKVNIVWVSKIFPEKIFLLIDQLNCFVTSNIRDTVLLSVVTKIDAQCEFAHVAIALDAYRAFSETQKVWPIPEHKEICSPLYISAQNYKLMSSITNKVYYIPSSTSYFILFYSNST